MWGATAIRGRYSPGRSEACLDTLRAGLAYARLAYAFHPGRRRAGGCGWFCVVVGLEASHMLRCLIGDHSAYGPNLKNPALRPTGQWRCHQELNGFGIKYGLIKRPPLGLRVGGGSWWVLNPTSHDLLSLGTIPVTQNCDSRGLGTTPATKHCGSWGPPPCRSPKTVTHGVRAPDRSPNTVTHGVHAAQPL